MDPELSGDHYLVSIWPEQFSQKIFVVVRIEFVTVAFGRIEKRVAAVKRLRDNVACFLLSTGSAVCMAHSHAPQPNGRDEQIFTQASVLHFHLF